MTPASERNLERVSCKAALYSDDHTRVLLVEYLPGKYGLPGGHVEQNETPYEAIRRELQEELGIGDEVKLEKRDFWRHRDGRIILGFVGYLDTSIEFTLDEAEIRDAVWTDISDIESGSRVAGGYNKFILQESQRSVLV